MEYQEGILEEEEGLLGEDPNLEEIPIEEPEPPQPEPAKVYTIALADGRQLTGLGLNGTNFVSAEKVDETIFQDNLSVMTVSDGETERVYHHVELIQQQKQQDGSWYLAFREKTAQELAAEALKEAMESITDMQLALAEVYEMILGGM